MLDIEHKGLLIAIDGMLTPPTSTDKGFATSFIRRLSLLNYGIWPFNFFESNTPDGLAAEHAYQDGKTGLELAYRYAIDRHQITRDIIKPALLADNKIFVCENYFLNSIVMSLADGCTLDQLLSINIDLLVPDLWIIVTAPEYYVRSNWEEYWLTEYELSHRAKKLPRFRKDIDYDKLSGFFNEAVCAMRGTTDILTLSATSPADEMAYVAYQQIINNHIGKVVANDDYDFAQLQNDAYMVKAIASDPAAVTTLPGHLQQQKLNCYPLL